LLEFSIETNKLLKVRGLIIDRIYSIKSLTISSIASTINVLILMTLSYYKDYKFEVITIIYLEVELVSIRVIIESFLVSKVELLLSKNYKSL
jgi:hypothetical protein